MTTFSERFLLETIDILSRVDAADLDAMVGVMVESREQGGRLFFCGSGGGAGHASHATCDFRKLGGFEAYCITDNVSELTARVNDDGWDTAYSNWLRASRFGAADCLFVFSVGGGSVDPPVSRNLVNCMELAKEVGAGIVGVAGRDGGVLRLLADSCVVIPAGDPATVTPQTEGLQALMWHLVVSHPDIARSIAKWEGLQSTVAAAGPR